MALKIACKRKRAATSKRRQKSPAVVGIVVGQMNLQQAEMAVDGPIEAAFPHQEVDGPDAAVGGCPRAPGDLFSYPGIHSKTSVRWGDGFSTHPLNPTKRRRISSFFMHRPKQPSGVRLAKV